jgi:hypothetical protein
MTQEPISLAAALASFDERWSPRIVTAVNDYDVRVAKVEGEHVWHVHYTVPRGTEHKPYAPVPTEILLFEPTGTLTVGDRHEDVPDHVDATTGHALR